MLTIWGRNNSINVQKVMWTVGELGLNHERHDVGGAFGGLDQPDYLAKNPNGLIPTLEDDGVTVWESHAIVRYLAAKYGSGSLWPEDPGLRAEADQWMDWMHTVILKDLAPVFVGLIRTPPEQRNTAAIEAGVAGLARSWAVMDQHLDGRAYVVGDGLTMGDIPVGCACYRYHALDIEHPNLPNVSAWYERLKAREGFRTHVMIPLS
jgi:glutathione S-transferase